MQKRLKSLNCKKCGNNTNTELLSPIGTKLPCPRCGEDCKVGSVA